MWSNFDEFPRIGTPTFLPSPLSFLPSSRSNFKLNTRRTGLIKLNAQSVLTRQQVQIASPRIAAATAWPTIPFCRCNNSPVLSPNVSAFIRLCRGHECSQRVVRLWDFHVASSTYAQDTPGVDGTFHRRRRRFRLLNGGCLRGASNRYDKIAHSEPSHSLPRVHLLFSQTIHSLLIFLPLSLCRA